MAAETSQALIVALEKLTAEPEFASAGILLQYSNFCKVLRIRQHAEIS